MDGKYVGAVNRKSHRHTWLPVEAATVATAAGVRPQRMRGGGDEADGTTSPPLKFVLDGDEGRGGDGGRGGKGGDGGEGGGSGGLGGGGFGITLSSAAHAALF